MHEEQEEPPAAAVIERIEPLLDRIERAASAAERATLLRELADAYEALGETSSGELEAFHRSRGEWASLVALLERKEAALASPAERIAALEEAARIAEEELADRARALAFHQRVALLDPAHQAASDAEIRLARVLARPLDLIAALERRARASSDPLAKVDRCVEAARVALLDLGDAEGALDRVARALDIVPTHPEALELAARLGARLPNIDPDLLDRLAERSEGSERADWLARAHEARGRRASTERTKRVEEELRLAELQLANGDRERAIGAYESMLATRPTDRALLTKLVGLHSEARAWDRVVPLVLRLAQGAPDEQAAKYFHTAGSIAHHEQGDGESAMSSYARAVAASASATKAFESWLELAAAGPENETAHRARLATLERATGYERERATSHRALATWLSGVGRHGEALAEAEKSLALSPADAPLARAMGAAVSALPERRDPARTALASRLTDASAYRALASFEEAAGRVDARLGVLRALATVDGSELDAGERAFVGSFSSREASLPAMGANWIEPLLHADLDPDLTRVLASLPMAAFATSAPGDAKVPEGIERSIAHAARVLGFDAPALRGVDAAFGLDVAAIPAVTILVGDDVRAGDAAVAFAVARVVASLEPRLASSWFARGLDSLRRTVLLTLSCAGIACGVSDEDLRPLEEALGAPGRARLVSAASKLSERAVDLVRHRRAVELSLDRIALVLAGDLAVALELVRLAPSAGLAPDARATELRSFAISEPYFEARRQLGMAVESGQRNP